MLLSKLTLFFYASNFPVGKSLEFHLNAVYISLPIFRYLRSGCTRYFCTKETESKLSRKSQDHSRNGGLKDPLQDDFKNFFLVDNDLKNLGMSDSERFAVYSTIASVLHLGNIGKKFELM